MQPAHPYGRSTRLVSTIIGRPETNDPNHAGTPDDAFAEWFTSKTRDEWTRLQWLRRVFFRWPRQPSTVSVRGILAGTALYFVTGTRVGPRSRRRASRSWCPIIPQTRTSLDATRAIDVAFGSGAIKSDSRFLIGILSNATLWRNPKGEPQNGRGPCRVHGIATSEAVDDSREKRAGRCHPCGRPGVHAFTCSARAAFNFGRRDHFEAEVARPGRPNR